MANKKKTRRNPWLVLLLVAIAIIVFIATPTENPMTTSVSSDTVVADAVDESLCLPANDGDIVYHPNYWLSYDEDAEQPAWVATMLTAEHVLTATPDRSDSFKEDPAIKTGSATLADYKNSGYDRGHLLSYASNGWNDEVADASFFLSNMSPQLHSFNAGIWLKLEYAERQCTVQNGILYVVSGPVLSDGPYETIGSNKVAVPKYFYKVFLDYTGDSTKAIGFILPHEKSSASLASFACSVDEVESITGIDFFPSLPDDDEIALESTFDVSLWDLSVSFDRQKAASKYGYDLDNLSSHSSSPSATTREPSSIKDYILVFLYNSFSDMKIDLLAMMF